MSDIRITDRGADVTVVVFSGIAPLNHVYEWTAAFGDFPVNLVGVKDPHECWYQRDVAELVADLRAHVAALGGSWLACVGGSAGGFAALKFGREIGADRVLAFAPQSACGGAKRALGDLRWPEHCVTSPSDDIAGIHERAIVHFAMDEPMDILHATRLRGTDVRRWPSGGHALPHRLKEDGKLRGLLQEVMP